MPDNLAQEGRGTDSVVGHLTPGEVVVPKELLNNTRLREELTKAFEEAGLDPNQYTVGSEANSINPETGYPEFFSLSKMLTGKSRSQRKRDAEAKARRAAKQEIDAAKKAMDRRMKSMDRRHRAAMKAAEKEARGEEAKGHAQLLISRKRHKRKLAAYTAPKPNLGAAVSQVSTKGPQEVTSASAQAGQAPSRRSRKKRRRALNFRRRPK